MIKIKKNKISFLEQKADDRYKYRKQVYEAVLTFIALSGFLASLSDIMYDNTVLFISILISAFISSLYYISSRISKNFDIIIYAVCLICFIAFIIPVARGFLGTVNRTITLYNLKFETEIRYFSLSNDSRFSSIIFWSLITVPLTAIFISLIRKKACWCIIFIMLASILFGFILGHSSMWISIACVICSVIGIIIFSLTPNRKIGSYSLLCISLSIAAFCVIAFFAKSYDGSANISIWKKNISNKIEKIRYGEDTLPHGDLKKANQLLIGNNTTFEINMDFPQELYLRGFIGADYTGNEWKILNKESYQDKYYGLIDWLNENGISIASQYSLYDKLSDETASNIQDKYNKISIKNVGAYRKYVYLPYSVVSWSGASYEIKKDSQVQAKGIFGADEYEFQDLINAPNADGMITAKWIQSPENSEQKKYIDVESVYHYFVEEKYLDISDELKKLINDVFFSDLDVNNMNFNEITAIIRTVLRRETQYEEYPNIYTNNEKDFIKSFLTESKKGNAVHYASAAVMAYRTLGYPARYVEGYHYKKGDKTSDIMTNQNAHVWAEVYVSGAGWIPVEVVPNMYVEVYTTQTIEGKPAYQISAKAQNEGININADGIEIDDTIKEPIKEHTNFGEFIPFIILFILYPSLALYLLLELQRAIRIIHRKNKKDKLQNQKLITSYAEEISKILIYAGVIGNYNHPLELTESISKKFPNISQNRYIRVISLMQKVRFGNKNLRKDEKYAIYRFVLKLKNELYKNKGFFGKLKLRYQYAIENNVDDNINY